MARIISVIAPLDFQDKEYADSRAALELMGHEVLIASTDLEAQGKIEVKKITLRPYAITSGEMCKHVTLRVI